jgi:prolyl oligopeptidase
MTFSRILVACFATIVAVPTHLVAQSPAPTTTRKPVTDTYHGTAVTEAYRWLENWNDSTVRVWSDSQNAHARAFLDGLQARPAIASRAKELYGGSSPSYFWLIRRGGQFFALKS